MESKIIRIEENQSGQVLDIRIKLEDQKWNRTSRIKVDFVKKNLTKLYHSRYGNRGCGVFKGGIQN